MTRRKSDKAKKAKPESEQNKNIRQESTVSGGDNYQAGRDVIVHQPAQDKSISKIIIWLGAIATVLTIISLLLDIPGKVDKWLSGDESGHNRFYGVVLDAEGQGVGNAHIQVFASEGDTARIGSGYTQPNGNFDMPIQAKQDIFVWVEVSKADHTGYRGLCTPLENPKIPFR